MLTKEQIAKRTGRLCGSEIYKLMKPKGIGQGGNTYIREKVAEMLTGERIMPEFTSASVCWGKDHEDEARKYFEEATGEFLLESDTLFNGSIAGTPDRVVQDKPIGFEIKCPYNSGNHLENLTLETAEDLKDLHEEYYWQIYAYMWLTGYTNWKFCSYDPRFKGAQRMLILNVEMNTSDMNLLKSRVSEALEIYNSYLKRFTNEG